MPETFDMDLFVAGVLAREPINLHQHDYIIVWSSGGKDSEAALSELVAECLRQGYPLHQVVVAHNNLGADVEWALTLDLAWRQAETWGLNFVAIEQTTGRVIGHHRPDVKSD